ncbi:leucine-rich repeat-containing G-protein coupled receptor 4 [Elysia marginata]|uniref:Leucine-rich repeat-containing G-protein coupled receptor 4 n=1 Tax=Elysia marginata TaxID=1093978 RepID=A0AAV4I971_9GAST|nr:leucine-rich repeat-containing G-protein coupled receptor 4 [Elysia marginata]
MKLPITVLVLWAGSSVIVWVTSEKTCEPYGVNSLQCRNVSRDTILQSLHSLTNGVVFAIKESHIDPFGTKEWSALSQSVEIFIEKTDLRELPAAGFGNFPCLVWLEITNSPIEVIPRQAFPNTVDSTGSHCSEDDMKSSLFHVSLHSNKIHTIEDDSFMAVSLEELNLNYNSIKYISGKFKFLTVVVVVVAVVVVVVKVEPAVVTVVVVIVVVVGLVVVKVVAAVIMVAVIIK